MGNDVERYSFIIDYFKDNQISGALENTQMMERIKKVFDLCKNEGENTIKDLIISTNHSYDRNDYDVYFFSKKKIYYIKKFMIYGLGKEYIIDIDDNLKDNIEIDVDEDSRHINVSICLGNHLIYSYYNFAFNIEKVVKKYLE